jgi:hypothetical protein
MERQNLPGNAYYVPPVGQPTVSLKTTVNTRMQLKDRVRGLQTTSHLTESVAVAASDEAPPPIRSYFLRKRFVGHTTYGAAAHIAGTQPTPAPLRVTNKQALGALPAPTPFDAVSNAQASVTYAHGDAPNFYSMVRKVERADDDQRNGLADTRTRSGAALNLRCAAIERKREQHGQFAPPARSFTRAAAGRPNGAPAMAEGAIKFAHVPHRTSSQIEYGTPRDVLRRAQSVQAAVRPMAGSLAADRAMVQSATAKDLFEGTSKSRYDMAAGFMGHIPASAGNVARLKGDEERLRAFSKCVVNFTQPGANSGARLAMKGDNTALLTVGGASLVQAAGAAEEQGMNFVEHGRKAAVRRFFTTGMGDQDHLAADQFCVKHRPLEGVMRHGPASQHSWISTRDLALGNTTKVV